MSHPLRPEQIDELCALIQALYDERITPEERTRLEEWVCRDKTACRIYAQYMNLFASIHWDKSQEPPPAPASPPRESQATRAPVLGFLGDIFQAGAHLLSRPFALSLLFAIALPGLILVVLLVNLRSQPAARVAVQPEVTRPIPTAPVAAGPVARVTQAHQCVWEKEGDGLAVGARLASGRLLRLSKGLLEVTFDGGARVLLSGPATFDATSAKEGRLRTGSLVAHVPAEARGFAVDTPAARIVDLGTEFGVRVEDEGRAADVQVFQGEVELTSPGVEDMRVAPRRLAAGRAVRAAFVGQASTVTITEITPVADRFVRQLPPAEPAKPAIVADFSGGNGDSQADQFPGTAGSGWASGWRLQGTDGAQCTMSVEQPNPVLDGGNYLRVSVEQARGRRGILRRLDVREPVDLTKPYVVSFSLRIDALGWFPKTVDQLVLCNISDTTVGEKGARSGWHIRVDARAYKGVKARHWSFVSGDGKGNFERFDSGIAVREGETYSFRILVDPAARQWTPSIGVNGGSPTPFGPMGMRSSGTAEQLGYWPNLYFYWIVEGGKKEADVAKLGFSVDSIRITAAEGK